MNPVTELIQNMNEHCENREKEGWIEWKEEDFDQLELIRNGCYILHYLEPEEDIPKLCDSCFSQYMKYKYETIQQNENDKDKEIQSLKARLENLEQMLITLIASKPS